MAVIQTETYVLSADRKTLVATDTTGVYNVTTNPGGYGGVNPAATYGPFITSTISIRIPDTNTFLPITTSLVVDVSTAWPSAANGLFNITSTILGGGVGAVLPAGWYVIQRDQTYDVGGGVVTLTTTANLLIFEPIQCCIDNLMVQTYGCSCTKDTTKAIKLAKATSYLALMQQRVVSGVISQSVIDECGQYQKAAGMLAEMQDLCDAEGCSTCS